MAKPRIYVTWRIPQEALNLIAEKTEMEVWAGELPPPYQTPLEKAGSAELDGAPRIMSEMWPAVKKYQSTRLLPVRA
jgi:hypothetical protein